MMETALNPLAAREVFHLEFLRRIGEKTDPRSFALKGGVNLRLFFGSPRYSEDLDLDVKDIPLERLQEAVMGVLKGRSFLDTLKTHGIKDLGLPDLRKSKQTETTQRFKVHLLTSAGEDLPTRIEISRRGMRPGVVVELVPDAVSRAYRAAPFWVPHYGLEAAIVQKTEALAGRTAVQARDIFDLHILLPRLGINAAFPDVRAEALSRARERLYDVEFDVFKDAVLAFLEPDARAAYDSSASWDEMRLRVAALLDRAGERHG